MWSIESLRQFFVCIFDCASTLPQSYRLNTFGVFDSFESKIHLNFLLKKKLSFGWKTNFRRLFNSWTPIDLAISHFELISSGRLIKFKIYYCKLKRTINSIKDGIFLHNFASQTSNSSQINSLYDEQIIGKRLVKVFQAHLCYLMSGLQDNEPLKWLQKNDKKEGKMICYTKI